MTRTGVASMFAGPPQPVEIHHRGIWYSGELVGWRHEANGRVAARVRCRIDGLLLSTWKDLAELRLPDPKHPPRKEPFPAVIQWSGAGDAEDPTRPHALLASMGTRPAKPRHAATPPTVRREEPPDGLPPARPVGGIRRNPQLRRREADFSRP